MDQNDIANSVPISDQEKSQISMRMSDVIDVIKTTDPTARDIFLSDSSGQVTDAIPHLSNTQNNNQTSPSMIARNNGRSSIAKVKIIEQPASKALRFRYECEGRSAGSIPGVNSTPENKTFPSIQVCNYTGRAVVVVSCVTKDSPYRPHPHNLVGKDSCKKGVCTVEVNSETMTATFSNLGIQCVKKKDIVEALRIRESIRVDPFRTGYSHRSQPSSIDLNAVRLCFQVFLQNTDPTKPGFTLPLPPIVSDPIYDKKAMSDLVICKLSKPSSSFEGGEELILLCEKVAKEDISVRFFEENQGVVTWEGFGDFQHTNVHKQVAISFRTPRFRTLELDHTVKCFIQLRRPSDGATSEALPFEYHPLETDKAGLKRKRLKTGNELNIFDQFQAPNISPRDGRYMQQQHLLIPDASLIKQEPVSPQRYTPSPNPILPTSLPQNMQMFSNLTQIQNPNLLNQQCQPQTSTGQFTMPITATNQIADFLLDTNQMNNLNNMNELDQTTNAQQNALDNYTNENLSNFLVLDNQQMSTTDMSGISSFLKYFNDLDNGDTGNEEQQATPIQANQIQSNIHNIDEENMTDSFNRISIG